MPAARPPMRALLAFASVSFSYFAFAGLFGTYAPLWFQNLGFSTLAIGVLASMQSSTRLFSPYAWGWFADHTGRRARLLRVAAGLALLSSLGYFAFASYGAVAVVTVLLFICTAGVIPISEAALAHFVSDGPSLDAGRYGRVRMWGSVGFIVAVVSGGVLLQAVGVQRFPWAASGLLALLLLAALRLPSLREAAHVDEAAPGALRVLREPVMRWFFAGMFLTVLAHVSLYVFLSLYLVSLGYSKPEVGLIWASGVMAEVVWFWFQGRWLPRFSPHAWLTVVALLAALRFALTAASGGVPALLLLAQLTHALTFAAQHSACISVINRHFPGRLRGRGQALYAVIGYGASGVIGGVAGGGLSRGFGIASVFWGASAVACLATVCCARAWAIERRGVGRLARASA